MLRCSSSAENPALQTFDDHLHSAITKITSSVIHWLQATLPIAHGGLGVRRVSSLAILAFLASYGMLTKQLRTLALWPMWQQPGNSHRRLQYTRSSPLPCKTWARSARQRLVSCLNWDAEFAVMLQIRDILPSYSSAFLSPSKGLFRCFCTILPRSTSRTSNHPAVSILVLFCL